MKTSSFSIATLIIASLIVSPCAHAGADDMGPPPPDGSRVVNGSTVVPSNSRNQTSSGPSATSQALPIAGLANQVGSMSGDAKTQSIMGAVSGGIVAIGGFTDMAADLAESPVGWGKVAMDGLTGVLGVAMAVMALRTKDQLDGSSSGGPPEIPAIAPVVPDNSLAATIPGGLDTFGCTGANPNPTLCEPGGLTPVKEILSQLDSAIEEGTFTPTSADLKNIDNLKKGIAALESGNSAALGDLLGDTGGANGSLSGGGAGRGGGGIAGNSAAGSDGVGDTGGGGADGAFGGTAASGNAFAQGGTDGKKADNKFGNKKANMGDTNIANALQQTDANGKDLSLWDRATRRYMGPNFGRGMTLAKIEMIRGEGTRKAKLIAANAPKAKKAVKSEGRKPASKGGSVSVRK